MLCSAGLSSFFNLCLFFIVICVHLLNADHCRIVGFYCIILVIIIEEVNFLHILKNQFGLIMTK